MNTTIAPKINIVEKIKFPHTTDIVLNNGCTLHTIKHGDQEVISFDLIFDTGKWNQTWPLVATFSASLMREGTATHKASEISQILDDTGSYLQINAGMHHTTITLFTLNKHLATLLPIVEAVVKQPAYDLSEFENFRSKKLFS